MARLRFRLLDSGPGMPAMNMAVDEVLLRGAEARPTLRLYAWDPPAVSLGYFQRIEDAPPTDLPVVRRLTGGGAIVHADEVTYSLAGPLAFFGEGVKESYGRVVEALREALGAVGARCERGADRRGDDAFLCYERSSAFDLVANGRKIVGSAQRRDGRRILQHGSIPLARVAEAAGRDVSYDELARAIGESFAARFDVDLAPAPLDAEELAAARALASERYAAEVWTALR